VRGDLVQATSREQLRIRGQIIKYSKYAKGDHRTSLFCYQRANVKKSRPFMKQLYYDSRLLSMEVVITIIF